MSMTDRVVWCVSEPWLYWLGVCWTLFSPACLLSVLLRHPASDSACLLWSRLGPPLEHESGSKVPNLETGCGPQPQLSLIYFLLKCKGIKKTIAARIFFKMLKG